MNDYTKNCENLTKMSEKSQNQKIRLFSKVDITTKLKIIEHQKQIFHKIKNSHTDFGNSLLTFVSFILAIDKVTKEFNQIDLNHIKLRSKSIKQNVKKEKLLTYWSIVKNLKTDKNYSFRDISKYLKTYHKFEVSYSQIYKIWNEIEKIKN